MSADQRLSRKSDFDAVFRDGAVAGGGPLTLRARVRPMEPESECREDVPCRFGYAVSKRLGSAVRRNRVRRRLRESARRVSAEGGCRGLDVVVIAREGAAEADFAELDATLRRLLARTQRKLSNQLGGAS